MARNGFERTCSVRDLVAEERMGFLSRRVYRKSYPHGCAVQGKNGFNDGRVILGGFFQVLIPTAPVNITRDARQGSAPTRGQPFSQTIVEICRRVSCRDVIGHETP